MGRALLSGVVSALAFALSACSDPETSGAVPGGGTKGTGGRSTGGSGGTGGQPPGPPPKLESLPAGWTAIQPGGDTLCAFGTAFQFFVRPGTVNRVLIEFSGSGACWDEESCRWGSGFYRQTAAPEFFVLTESGAWGIRNHNDARNPFKDWHHVYIPSCGGSGHWGDATITYGTGASAYTVYFRGTANSRAALAWVFENVTAPEKAFVTGCSGGSWASLVWSAQVREHYGAATKVYQFGDSGLAIVPSDWANANFPSWNTRSSYPTFIPDAGPEAFEPITAFFATLGNHFDDMFLSLFTPHADGEQYRYYAIFGGGPVSEWTARAFQDIATITATTPNFRSFVAPGTYHCMIPYPTFYEVESHGVKVVDWITQVVEDKPVSSVSCAPDCDAPADAGSP